MKTWILLLLWISTTSGELSLGYEFEVEKRLTKKCITNECCQAILDSFRPYFRSFVEESPFPFESTNFKSQCKSDLQRYYPKHPLMEQALSKIQEQALPKIQEQAWETSVNKYRHTLVMQNPSNIIILYIVLVHENADSVVRLIDSLRDHNKRDIFIIHVDKKGVSDTVYNKLSGYEKFNDDVLVLPNDSRTSVIWGGFSVVNSTLLGLEYAFIKNLEFDYVINLSGSTYPLKPVKYIKEALADNFGSIHMDIQPVPFQPHPEMWNHYIECDDKLHRITRLPPPRGLNMYMGSQWFALPYDVSKWLMNDNLPRIYISYAKHTFVADETYFSTMVKSSPFCDRPFVKNLLFLQFDVFENEKANPDENKCVGVSPNKCGRSPITFTYEHKDLLAASMALFARKFDITLNSSKAALDYIDMLRTKNQLFENTNVNSEKVVTQQEDRKLVIIADDNILSKTNYAFENLAQVESWFKTEKPKMCLELQPPYNDFHLKECDPTNPKQLFILKRCRNFYYENMENNPTGPLTFCQIVSNHNSNCLDVSGQNIKIGTYVITHECTGNWNQYFYFSEDNQVVFVKPKSLDRKLINDVALCWHQRFNGNLDRHELVSNKCLHLNRSCDVFNHTKSHANGNEAQQFKFVDREILQSYLAYKN